MTQKNKIVIIHGLIEITERRSGMLLKNYGMKRIVNNWNGNDDLCDGDIAITELSPPFSVPGARIVDIAKAKAAILRTN